MLTLRVPGAGRRVRLAAYSVLGLALIAAMASLWEIRSEKLRGPARAFLESMIDRRIEVGEASFNLLGRVTLRDVRVFNRPGYPSELMLYAPRVRFALGMTGGETSAFRPTAITFEDAVFSYQRTDSLPWNTEDLWVNKSPRHDHPTFTLPIALRNVTLLYSDSQVGRAGVALQLPRLDADFTVTSDGTEIRNALNLAEARLPQGGAFALAMRSHPNARTAEVVITLTDAEVTQLAAYHDFITLFEISQGRVDGSYRMEFRSGGMRAEADLRLAGATLRHRPSGTEFRDAALGIIYEGEASDTRVALRRLKVHWRRSVVEARGEFTTRRAPERFRDVTFTAERARAEDLAFLLCDPALEPIGELAGSCRLFTARGEERYAAEIDLDRAEVKYGTILAKPAGVRGRLVIEGAAGARPERIGIEVAASKAAMTPLPERGWRLQLAPLEGADALEYLVSLEGNDGLALAGPLGVKLRLARGGEFSGSVDFTAATLKLGGALDKPAGARAVVDVAGRAVEGGIEAGQALAHLGRSRFSFTGRLARAGSDLDLKLVDVDWADVRRFLPKLWSMLSRKVRCEGRVAGRLRFRPVADRKPPALSLQTDLILDDSELDISGYGRKRRGEPSRLALAGAWDGAVFQVDTGALQLGRNTYGLEGWVSAGKYELEVTGAGLGLALPLKKLTGILTAPARLGRDMLGDLFSGDSPVSATDTPKVQY